jgi:hypothetical protein
MPPTSAALIAHLKALAARLKPTDVTPHIAHLNRLLSTTSYLDTTLLTVTYTLHLLHALLHRLSAASLARTVRNLLSNLPAPLKLVVLLATPPPPPSRLLLLTTRTAALAALIDDFRIFLRLRSMLAIWCWGARTLQEPPADTITRVITWAQVTASAATQLLENGAYLGSKGVVGLGERSVARWYVWSSRFWALYVGLEFWRLGRVRAARLKEREAETVQKIEVNETEGKAKEGDLVTIGGEQEKKVVRAREEAEWWSQIYVNMAWAPLTVHWSMEKGFAGEGQVALLGIVAGVFGLKEAWQATA